MSNWKINFNILKKCKELGHCVCDLSHPCPCDEFLNKQKCKCRAYIEVKEDE